MFLVLVHDDGGYLLALGNITSTVNHAIFSTLVPVSSTHDLLMTDKLRSLAFERTVRVLETKWIIRRLDVITRGRSLLCECWVRVVDKDILILARRYLDSILWALLLLVLMVKGH